MRVLFFIEDVLSKNFGTPLELAVNHLRVGDEVDFVVCRGALRACPSNSRHDELACRLCRSRLDNALMAPLLKGVTVSEVEFTEDDLALPSCGFSSISELKGYSIDDENVGLDAASSVITVLLDPRPDLAREAALVESNLRTSVSVYRWFNRCLSGFKPDLVYVLNGRRSSQAPVLRAARNFGCDMVTYEIGHDSHKYILVPGTYFHDLGRKKADMRRYWVEEKDPERREALGHQFYKERRYGSGDQFLETKFKKFQAPGTLPHGLSREQRNVVVYNSSEFEFAAVEGWDNPVYPNQIVGLERILNDPRLDPDLRIWLRVHPNLAGLQNSQIEAISRLDPGQVSVIGPEEAVDTYALMEAAEKVLTFGSTTSVEAAYWGVPSILIGREAFEESGSCYTPANHDEVMALINDRNLQPLPVVGALMYGHFMIARDIEYQIYDPVEKVLDGHPARPSAWISLLARLRWWQPLGRFRWWLGRKARRLLSSLRSAQRASVSR